MSAGATPGAGAPDGPRAVVPVRTAPVWRPAAQAAAAAAEDGTVDVGAFVTRAARSWRAGLVGLAAGLAAGAAVVALVPPSYRARTTVLLRSGNESSPSLLGRVGGALGDAANGLGAIGGLGSALGSPIETEIQLLSSRDVLGQVVDSLGLQARVVSPRGVPSRLLLRPARYPGAFRPRELDVRRDAAGRHVVRDGAATATVAPGGTATLPVLGAVPLAGGPLPAQFRVVVEDREDAITRLAGRLAVTKAGGEVTEVRYTGPDSATASAVPNAVVAVYLERRRTTDRGINQRRFEFLAAQADSVAAQLAGAEDALRTQQERTGVYDPDAVGRTGIEAVRDLRRDFGTLDAEQQAARALVERAEAGALGVRELAAFPAFLRAPAVNSIITQINELETERTQLLERRTPQDPAVTALAQGVRDLEGQLLPLARTYAASLGRQGSALRAEGEALRARLAELPGQAQGALRLQRDVRRLSQTLLALQTQMIDARLAAIGEGGQVRQVDVARAPKRPLFPRPLPVLVGGALLGLLAGTAAGGVRGARRGRIRRPEDAERMLGAPVARLVPGRALLLARGLRRGAVAGVGVGEGGPAAARAVARQLAAQSDAVAAAHGASAHGADGAGGAAVPVLDALDAPLAPVVLDAVDAVVLAAAAQQVRGEALRDAWEVLALLDVPCAGLVLVDLAAEAVGAPEAVRVAARQNGQGHGVAV